MTTAKHQIHSFRKFLQIFSPISTLSCLALSTPVAASVTSLTGSLTDPQGSVVAGASVRLLRRADSSSRETQTDGQGEFSFSNLDAGEYRLTAESPGFAPITRTIVLFDGSRTERIQFSDIVHRANPSRCRRMSLT